MKIPYIIDFDLLQRVVMRTNGYCLCKLDSKCPCPKFAGTGKCDCGVFTEVKKDGKE